MNKNVFIFSRWIWFISSAFSQTEGKTKPSRIFWRQSDVIALENLRTSLFNKVTLALRLLLAYVNCFAYSYLHIEANTSNTGRLDKICLKAKIHPPNNCFASGIHPRKDWQDLRIGVQKTMWIPILLPILIHYRTISYLIT